MNNQELIRALDRLSQPGKLAAACSHMDADKPRKRIYIMGCGRSGTWLLTTLFTCFSDIHVIPKELPIEYFGLLKSDSTNLVIKRHDKGYERVEEIPESISIIWIVRHPFDVLTSHNPMSGRRYHIHPWRFLGEIQALQYLIETKRSNMTVIKYEDLVQSPINTLNKIANEFKMTIKYKPYEIITMLKLPIEADKAMHGVRKIDTNSIGRYKQDPENVLYLKKIYLRIKPVLGWVEREFNYKMNLFD